MRIQSDFKDFYDCGMATGQDQTLVYLRYTKTEKTKQYFPVFAISSWRYPNEQLDFSHNVIGFCGKVYPVIRVSLREQPKGPFKWCYKVEDVDNFIRANFKRSLYADYLARTKSYDRKSKWSWTESRYNFERYFQKFDEEHKDRHADMFLDAHCPVFVWERSKEIGRASCRERV